MPRWLRVIRGMIGTGLTFAAGVGVVGSIIGGLVWLLGSRGSPHDLIELIAHSTVIAFPLGAAFSGVLAITARGRSFDKLSLPRFAALGAGAGLLVFAVLSINAFKAWSVADAVANVVVLTLMGGASATAILLLARRTSRELEPGDEPRRLGDG